MDFSTNKARMGSIASAKRRSWRLPFFILLAMIVVVLWSSMPASTAQFKSYLSGLLENPEEWQKTPEADDFASANGELLDEAIGDASPQDVQDETPEAIDFPEANGETLDEAIGDEASEETEEEKPEAEKMFDDPDEVVEGFDKNKVFFEFQVPYNMPDYDVNALRTMAPHNYKGPGHPTFSTFFLSRNDSLHDPYYVATHQVVYRLLWNEETKSRRYPVTVFVAPFVTDEQRAYFEAAGAIVREVAQLPFTPNLDHPVAHRLKDVFSKLEMWNQTDFSRIVFLDSDAFPMVNIDVLLDGDEVAPTMKCKTELLPMRVPIEELEYARSSGLCDYVFTGVPELGMTNMTNAGMMVLKPNAALHELLLREYHNQGNFDHGFVEQALLGYVFNKEGPFPAHHINRTWNSGPEYKDEGNPQYILHAKLWAMWFGERDYWADKIFGNTWADLTTLYESEEFTRLREEDEATKYR